MRVLVTGASGFIGSAVVAELLGAGHDVVGLARSDASAAALTDAGAEVARGSLADLDVLGEQAAAADGVVHLAFMHGTPMADAAGADRQAIDTLGAALEGSDRPLVATGGTLGLPTGRVGTERDHPVSGPDASPRGDSEALVAAWAQRGVRSAMVRLAPSVHDGVRRGFVGALIDAARNTGVSGYVGDGAARWPAVHRLDAAALFRLALEGVAAGSTVHGVADEGVPTREIAQVIGTHLNLPVESVPAERAAEHFGWVGPLLAVDSPASSALTREWLGWQPTHPGLLDDLEHGHFFD